jgi:hypothetical protein
MEGNDKIVTMSNLSRYHNKLSQLFDDYVKLEDVPSIEYCTNNDILRLFDTSIPEEPVEPEVPTESVGSITEDNSIVIDETQLENGTYTLRYIDSNGNAIDNFNEIASFEINR